MTLVARVGKHIAVDGRITDVGIVTGDDYEKFHRDYNMPDYVFMFCGDLCNFAQMAHNYKLVKEGGVEEPDYRLFVNTTMFVFNLKTGDLQQVEADEDLKMAQVSYISQDPYFFGAGKRFAWGAYEMSHALCDIESPKTDEDMIDAIYQSVSKRCASVGNRHTVFSAE